MAEDFTRSVQIWPASTHRMAACVIQDSAEGHSCVCIYQQGQKGIELTRRPLFTNSTLHKAARLNNKLVVRTVLDKTRRNIGLLTAVLKGISYNL
jgi:hypothetical protein